MIIADRVKEKTTTIGTGSYLLAGALKSFQSFANALTDNDETYYVVEDGESWEVGTGTFNATENIISRDTIHASSNDDNLVNWTPGEKRIFISAPAVFLESLGDITTHAQNTDQALDAGGANEVTAAQAKAAYTHSQADHAPSNAETNRPISSQGQAEAGVDNTTTMSPLRVAQAIAVLAAGLKNNYAAVTDPSVDDDSDEGYSVGSYWINAAEAYRCADASVGAAVWVKTTLTVDELNAIALSGNSDDLTEGVNNLLMTSDERDKAGNTPANTNAELAKKAEHAKTQQWTKWQGVDESNLTDAATIQWPLESNQNAVVTLAGNRALSAPTQMKTGYCTLTIIQDATGARTLDMSDPVFNFRGETLPELSTAAGKKDMLQFYCDGSEMRFISMVAGY